MLKKSLAVGIIVFLVISSVSYSTLSNEISTGTFGGNTLYVGGTGPGNYTIIQDAIDNASDGGTVFAYSGTYYENLIVDKSIILAGEGRSSTTIDGSGSGDVIKITASNVNIFGFTVTNGRKTCCGAAVYIYNSHYNTISGNIISETWRGIKLVSSNYNVISDNIINYNNGAGIFLSKSSYNDVYDNAILDNHAGIGILTSSDDNIILNNIIESNRQIGITISESDNNVISENLINFNLWRGINLYKTSGNTISSNTISNNKDNGISIQGYSNNTFIHHNNFLNNEPNNALDNYENYWDDGIEGNYWDDYTGIDTDGDGIGDIPYNIPRGNNKDRYPLMEPYTLIEVEIKGGFGLKIIIKNVGDAVFTNLTVHISIDGQIILGRQSSGEIMFLEPFNPGVEATLRLFIFGFGRVTINVLIEEQKWKVEGLLLGPFVFILDNYRCDVEWI